MGDSELVLKCLAGGASQKELGALEALLNKDLASKTFFTELKNTWDLSSNLEQPFNIDKIKAWSSVQQKILQQQEDPGVATKLLVVKSYKTSWLFRIAAVFIIVLFATWFFLNRSEHLLTVQTAATKKVIVLPDSTRVYLNENSTISYPEVFESDERSVSMIGEGFFEVTKDAKRPFVIRNKAFDIKVLGTSFNVSDYAYNPNAIVTVVEGKVSFADKSGNSIVLLRDETGMLNKSKHSVEKSMTEDLNVLSWKTRKLEFKNTNFKAVCEKLKEYFSVELEVKNENILKCKFTGYFVDPSLEQILSVLEKTLEIKTIVNNKQIIITGKGC